MNRPELTSQDGREEISARNLRELLDEPDHVPTAARTRLIDHYAPVDKPLPPRSAMHPRTTAKPAVRGKAVPFRTSRMFVAAFIITAIAMMTLTFARWYAGQVVSLNNAAEEAAKARAEVYKKAQDARIARAKAADKNQFELPARKIAPYVDQVRDWGVSVIAAQIDGENLKITLRISNYSDESVACPDWSLSTFKVILRDNFGNMYNRIEAGEIWPKHPKNIAPGKSTNDYLLFEAPTVPVAQLDLDLPIYGSDRPFEFGIQRIFIQSAKPTNASSPSSTPPAPPIQAEYDPLKDLNLIREINMKYRQGIEAMNRRIQFMSYNNGTKYRKTQTARIRKDLAEKYDLDDAQLQRILKGQ